MTRTMTPIEALATAHHSWCCEENEEPERPCHADDFAAEDLAHLPPGFAFVSVEEVARRLHEHYEMEAVGVVPGGRWEGQTYIDETRACTPQDHMAQARRLLGGRE